MQNDFFKGGPLTVPHAEEIIPTINKLIQTARKNDALIVYTADAHPKETQHFSKWPVHCVAGTFGAMFHPDLDTSADYMNVLCITKGKSTADDGYSAFDDTGLSKLLQKAGIRKVLVCGVATEFCVYQTVLDASVDFMVTVFLDACRPVNPASIPTMITLMRACDAQVVE
jgi:nicotinamidase/pyrazinamidase